MIKRIIFTFCLFTSMISWGQDSVAEYLSDLSGKRGYTTIEFTPFMFDLIRDCSDQEDISEEQDLFNNIESMLMVTTKNRELVPKVISMSKSDRYQLMMDMYDEDQSHLIFYVKKKGKKVSDFLMLVDGEGDLLILKLKCDLTMKQLKTVTRQISVRGVNKFEIKL